MKKILIVSFIFILSCSVRLAYLSSNPRGIESDEITYDDLAMKLVETKGYVKSEGNPTSYRPPLYPSFLALIYMVFGHNHFVVLIIQIIISSLTVCLLYLTAEKIFNRLTAVFTGIFASFYMTFVVCARLLYTETLFTFLLAWLIFLIVTIDRPNVKQFCTMGFLCGFLTLVRGSALFMPFIAILFLVIKKKREMLPMKKRAFVAVMGLLLCFTSVLLPWSIRNYRVHGKFVLVSTNAGVNLYQGVIRSPERIFHAGPEGEVVWDEAITIQNEAERNNFFLRKAIAIYKARPLFALKMFIVRFLFFWNIIDWEIMGGEIVNYHYIFILPFSLLGTIFAFKDKKEISVILLMVFYFASFTLLFPGTPRYRMPIDGYIIMLGCYGIYEFVQRQKKVMPILYTGFYFLCAYLLYKYSLQTKASIRGLMEMIGLW